MNKEWEKIKKEHYMEDCCINVGDGFINFSLESMKDFSTDDFKSYDEYLDIQWKSLKNTRRYFEMCYYCEEYSYFKGQIERMTSDNILFKRILVSGMYSDGLGFEGKEDHVWMDKAEFEGYKAGDCLRFSAEVYRYIKKNNGKMMDYGLRNPEGIEIIQSYEIPTDEDLINQQIDQLVCETCLFTNHCYMGMCIADEKDREEKIAFLKQIEPGKFTEFTVLAAYEMAGQVFSQLTGGKLDKNDPNYEINKKIINEAGKRNAGCVWPLEKALCSMLIPEKPRLYIR